MNKLTRIASVLLVSMLLLTSCVKIHMYSDQYTGQIPGSSNAYQMADGEYYPRGLTATAIKIFYKQWKDKFGDQDKKVIKALNNIRILWIDNEDGVFSNCKGKVYGENDINQNVIKIAVRLEDKSIAATSLIHELVHEANYAVNEEYDYDHTGVEYHGWTEEHDKLIKETNKLIREAEIKFNKERKALTEATSSAKVRKKGEEDEPK